MSHPVGVYISKSQPHELNYWLVKHNFKASDANREKLKELIDVTKMYFSKSSSEHLKHIELDEYYNLYDYLYDFE